MSDPAPRPIDAIRAMLGELLGGPDASIAHRRRQAAVFAANQPPLPAGVSATATTLGGVAAERIEVADGAGPGVFLHLHGGGYVMGAPADSRGFTTALALATGARVVSVDYRLAPEHRFPAAVDDALAAYRGLVEAGTPPGAIAVGGESAGGGLAVALLLAIRGAGLPQPACAVAMSPWADLACAGASHETCAARDPLLTRAVLLEMAEAYLDGHDALDPLASPMRADLSGLAPLLIQVGADEVLRDDAVELAARARACGVTADLEVWPEMIHVWQMFGAALPEAGQAIERIARFVEGHWRTAG